jgi:hypothetical protein
VAATAVVAAPRANSAKRPRCGRDGGGMEVA